MSGHVALKRNKQIKFRRRRMINKTIIFFVVIFSIFGLLVWGAHSEKIRISNVSTQGNRVVLNKDIKTEILKSLTGNYFWIFPKNNIFIYPKQQIKKDILKTFSRIDKVEIKMVDLNTIDVAVNERVPFALWCGNSLYKTGRTILDKCYFLDKNGFIFIQAPDFSGNVYFEFYGVIKNEIIGEQFLPKKEFERIISFRDLLINANIKVNKFLIDKSNGDYIFYLNNKNKTAIFFNKSEDFNKMFYNLKSAIDTKISETGEKNIFKNLKYIDLRFKNKVLFKF